MADHEINLLVPNSDATDEVGDLKVLSDDDDDNNSVPGRVLIFYDNNTNFSEIKDKIPYLIGI